jgi:hypothetical protein
MNSIAHLGGEATAKKFGGSEYFRMLANKRWTARRNKNNDEYRTIIKKL